MTRWTESNLGKFIDMLKSNDLEEVAWVLTYYMDGHGYYNPEPIGNDEIISYLKHLIEDQRLCKVNWGFPSRWGELRWSAARVLACEYAYKGIDTPIILKDVLKPVTLEGFGTLSYLINRIEKGLMPTVTQVIRPQEWCELCCKEAVEKRLQQNKDD